MSDNGRCRRRARRRRRDSEPLPSPGNSHQKSELELNYRRSASHSDAVRCHRVTLEVTFTWKKQFLSVGDLTQIGSNVNRSTEVKAAAPTCWPVRRHADRLTPVRPVAPGCRRACEPPAVVVVVQRVGVEGWGWGGALTSFFNSSASSSTHGGRGGGKTCRWWGGRVFSTFDSFMFRL